MKKIITSLLIVSMLGIVGACNNEAEETLPTVVIDESADYIGDSDTGSWSFENTDANSIVGIFTDITAPSGNAEEFINSISNHPIYDYNYGTNFISITYYNDFEAGNLYTIHYYDYGVDGDGNIVVGENPQVEVSLVFATEESAMPVYQSFISYFFNKYPAIDTTEDLSLYDINGRRAVGDYETYSVTMYNAIVDSSSVYEIDIMERVV